MELNTYRVYAEQKETFYIEIQATSKEAAEELAMSDDIDYSDWKEVDGSMEFNILVGETNE